MTPQEREVMQMALELLPNAIDLQQAEIDDHITKYGEWYRPQRVEFMRKFLADAEKTMEALRAALAQPEQEPQWRDAAYRAMDLVIEQQAQPEQKPVAQVQVAEDYYPHVVFLDGVDTTGLDQKFLYTAPPQRERIMCGCGDQIMPDDGAECGTCVTARNAVQREWQGLTDEDREEIDKWIEFKEAGGNEPVPAQKLVTYVEAKLKEKNHDK